MEDVLISKITPAGKDAARWIGVSRRLGRYSARSSVEVIFHNITCPSESDVHSGSQE